MFADRVLAFDHVTHAVYLLCLGLKPRSKEDEETEERASREWFDHIEQRLAASDQVTSTKSPAKFISPSAVEHPAIPFTLQRPYEQYKGEAVITASLLNLFLAPPTLTRALSSGACAYRRHQGMPRGDQQGRQLRALPHQQINHPL
jgi:hypothetical protein